MDQSLSNKHRQQNNRKRGLFVAITRNTLTQNLAKGTESVTTRTNIVVTQTGVFTLESQLLANNPHAWKVNGK